MTGGRERQIFDEAVDVVFGRGEDVKERMEPWERSTRWTDTSWDDLSQDDLFRTIFLRMVFLFVRKVLAYDLHRSDGEWIGIVTGWKPLAVTTSLSGAK